MACRDIRSPQRRRVVTLSKRVLLTGAAGLLGGEIAGRLLDRGYAVTALVNRTRIVRRNDSTVLPGEPWSGHAPPPGGLALLGADLARERLGWDDGTWRKVAAAHDLIVHSAAITAFAAPDEHYRSVNIGGTERAIALAEAGGMGLVHISTAYVCGTRDGRIGEHELDCGQAFHNGYEASKAAAERKVRDSRLDAVIARPSIVVGAHETGAIRAFDTIYSVLKLMAEGRIRTVPSEAGATLDLVPIDHVAAGIVRLVEQFGDAVGGTCHLVSGAPSPVADLSALLASCTQASVARLVHPAAFDVARMAAPERRLFERSFGPYTAYLSRNPRFDDAEARRLTGLICPRIDAAYWRRLIQYALESGFLRPAACTA